MISGRAAAVISAPLLAATLAGCSGNDGIAVQTAAGRLATLTERAHASLDRVSPETTPWVVTDDGRQLHAVGCPSGRRYARHRATMDQKVSPTGETRANRQALVVGFLSGDWKLAATTHQDTEPFTTTLSFAARGDNPGGLRLRVTFDRRGASWHVAVDSRTDCLVLGSQ